MLTYTDLNNQLIAHEDRLIAREFRRRLEKITAVRDLRVFGSRARGDAAPDSDMDIFIELASCSPTLRERISELAWEVGFEKGRVISTLVATTNDLEHGAMGANPVWFNIRREGIAI